MLSSEMIHCRYHWIQRDELAIDHCFIRQPAERISDVIETFGEVIASPRVKRDVPTGGFDFEPVAIQLQPVSPPVTFGNSLDRQALHRLD